MYNIADIKLGTTLYYTYIKLNNASNINYALYMYSVVSFYLTYSSTNSRTIMYIES